MRLRFWRRKPPEDSGPQFTNYFDLADWLADTGRGQRTAGKRGGPQVISFPPIVRRDSNTESGLK